MCLGDGFCSLLFFLLGTRGPSLGGDWKPLHRKLGLDKRELERGSRPSCAQGRPTTSLVAANELCRVAERCDVVLHVRSSGGQGRLAGT